MREPEPQTGTVQGRDQITINAPLDRIWGLIADSKMLEQWGPVVDKVDVQLNAGETREGIGTRRHIYITVGKRSGRLIERRTEHNPNRTLAYRIEEDPFLGPYLKDSGFTMELDPLGHAQTLFTFTFYQRPRGFRGWLVNPLVRIMQRRGRRAGLASLKELAERPDASGPFAAARLRRPSSHRQRHDRDWGTGLSLDAMRLHGCPRCTKFILTGQRHQEGQHGKDGQG